MTFLDSDHDVCPLNKKLRHSPSENIGGGGDGSANEFDQKLARLHNLHISDLKNQELERTGTQDQKILFYLF